MLEARVAVAEGCQRSGKVIPEGQQQGSNLKYWWEKMFYYSLSGNVPI
jgi:hypothetical protein